MGRKKRRHEKKKELAVQDQVREHAYVHQERIQAAKRRKIKVLRTWAFVLVALLLIGALVYAMWPKPSPYLGFASCLSERGLVMYGTDWCQFCQEQKRLFGSAFREVDYRNCDLHAEECRSKGVTSYPTWIFSNGSRVNGVQQLATLGEMTNCTLSVATP